MKRLRGFTLIELLVVISVIALLLAILMPALQRAKRITQATVCRSNVKQWGLIFHLYADDNEGKLPQSVAGGGLTAQESYWIIATLPYYQDKKIRMCPSTKIVRDEVVNRSHGGTFAAWGPFDPGDESDWWTNFDTGSYGSNEWCSCPPPAANTYWGFGAENAWRTVDVKGASRVPLFLDCVYVDLFPLHGDEPLDFEPPAYSWSNGWGDWGFQAMRLACIDRHSGGINAVFLDNSVGKIPLRALWKLKWHRTFDTSGPWTKRHSHWPDWLTRYSDEY